MLFVIAQIILITAAKTQETEESPLWICNSSNYCLIDTASNISDVKRFESQYDCRLSCGKYGAVWPMPTGDCSLSEGRVQFDPSMVQFNIVASSFNATEFINKTNDIFLSNINNECSPNCTLNNTKVILINTTISDCSLSLDWSTDESYVLVIETEGNGNNTFVKINATTVYGARHALETLSNLITGSINNGLLIVANASIDDRPLYPHRGVLLDTARNFIPLSQIRRTLDAMATSKLNVFHWHVVDTQSFPLEITTVPEMQSFGAYSPTDTYSRSDTINLIEYARYRGIRVIIEIDGPSHAGNGWQWGPTAGMGNMAVCVNQQPWQSFCIEPPCGQLNPLNDNMYSVMKKIYEEIAVMGAPEETIHMGGDEVFIDCWNRTEEITREMENRSLDSFYELWSKFHQKNLASWDNITQTLFPNLEKLNKSAIVWSSHLTNSTYIEQYFPKERFIIQTWVESSKSLNNELLNKGYRIIISTKDAWYLDHGLWGTTKYYNWEKVYDNPIAENSNILGGEVCMWGEYVDQFSVEARIWPRAGAAAERLWSNPKSCSRLATYRFYRFRERLISRGLGPDAVAPMWCALNEGQCFKKNTECLN